MNTQANAVENEVMCTCTGTTRGNIYDLVQQGMDAAAISRWTGAMSGCAGCECDIQAFVTALQAASADKTT